jgi:hypothetical protein
MSLFFAVLLAAYSIAQSYCFLLRVTQATSFCFFISALTRSIGQANLAASLFFIYCMVYGGLLLNNDKGSSLITLQYGSFFHYAWEALMINEFSGLVLIFDPSGFRYD